MNNNNLEHENLFSEIKRDTTIRLPFRNKDMLVHFRYTDVLTETLSILEIFELHTGDSVIITNRSEDLPDGFKLHPTEVCDLLAFELIDQFNAGDYPIVPMDANNLWRIREGDLVVWFGENRPDINSESGILKIFKFLKCSLLYGESKNMTLEKMLKFGKVTFPHDYEKSYAYFDKASDIIKKNGLPRGISTRWLLG